MRIEAWGDQAARATVALGDPHGLDSSELVVDLTHLGAESQVLANPVVPLIPFSYFYAALR